MHIKKITWVFLISFLALGLRLYLAYYGPVDNDETDYFHVAIVYNQAMRQGNLDPILNLTFNSEHPAFYKLVYAMGLFVGKPLSSARSLSPGNEITFYTFWHKLLILRSISALFGALTVFLLALIQPIAGLFLAFDTIDIHYTSVIYLEALPAFANLVAIIAATKALEAYKKKPGISRKCTGWLVLSSLALGMSAASKYIYGIIGIVIVVITIIDLWKHKTHALIGLAVWGALGLTFFFLLNPYTWSSPISRLAASMQYFANYAGSEEVLKAGYPFWQPIRWLMYPITQQPNVFFFNKSDYFVRADTLIFVLAVIGLPAFYIKNRPMFIWLVVGMVFLLWWNTKWPQYVMLVTTPFCLSAAYGFNFILSNSYKLISGLWRHFRNAD